MRIPLRPPLTRRDWLVVAAAVLLLLLLAHGLEGQDPMPFDDQLLRWLGLHLKGVASAVLVQIYRMSGVGFTGILVLAAVIYLIARRWWRDLGLLVMATGGILAIIDLWLKPCFDRARPHERLIVVDGRSFPSGHAAGSICFYLAMVAILSFHHPRLRLPLSIGAVAWISLVWLSTLAARAHWPTDLLAGGAVGVAWLTICLAYWRTLRAPLPHS